jgi:hypothetical protein
MTVFQEKGVYSGGVMTLNVLSDNEATLDLSPYLVHLYNDDITGIGETQFPGVGKRIYITNGTVFAISTPREATKAPTYNIQTTGGTGHVWIYYDEIKKDIALSGNTLLPNYDPGPITNVGPPPNTVVFGLLIIKSGGSLIDGAPGGAARLMLNTDFRTEAYLARTSNPSDAKYFYHDGQRFIGGELNVPLANQAVMTEVIQEESLSTFGGEYFLTIAQQAEQVVKGYTQDPFGINESRIDFFDSKHIWRQQLNYTTYHTKEDAISYPPGDVGGVVAYRRVFSSAGDVHNKLVRVLIHKQTGEPEIFLSDEVYTANDYHVVAVSAGPLNESNDGLSPTGVLALSDITWDLPSSLTTLNTVLTTEARGRSSREPSGFYNEFDIVPSATENAVSVPELVGNIDGFMFTHPANGVDLGAAPSGVGATQEDFVFLQLTKKYTPEIQLEGRLRAVQGLSWTSDPDGFNSPLVTAWLDGESSPSAFQFTYIPEKGHYQALGVEDGFEYYALPLAWVHRFNQNNYGTANFNGGVGRPDNKTFNNIDIEEILTVAPTINTHRDKHEILQNGIRQVLEGSLRTSFEAGAYSGVLSTQPFQQDHLGASTTGGTKIGDLDGGRRLWSNNLSKVETIGAGFEALVGENRDYAEYNNANHSVTIKIPVSSQGRSEIVKDINGQPLGVTIQWCENGLPLQIQEPWELGTDPENDDSLILATTYIGDATGLFPDNVTNAGTPPKFVVNFQIRHLEPKGFTKPASELISALRGDNEGKDDYFALAPSTANNPTYVKDLPDVDPTAGGTPIYGGSGVTCGSTTYYPELFIERYGPNTKGYAHRIVLPHLGSNVSLTPYSIDDIITTSDVLLGDSTPTDYQLLCLLDVTDKNGRSLFVRDIEWTPGTPGDCTMPGTFKVYTEVVPTDEVLFFHFGMEGNQLDYNAGSLEISNLTKAEAEGAEVASSEGITYYCYEDPGDVETGAVFFGFSSFAYNIGAFAEIPGGASTVWVPVKVRGFNSSLFEIETKYTYRDYDSLGLTALQKQAFEDDGDGHMRIIEGSCLKFSFLRGLVEGGSVNSTIVLKYKYSASPFRPYDITKPARLAHDGFMVLSTDGVANEGASDYAPVSERFPVVQGINVIGTDTESSPVGINPTWAYQQVKEWASAGAPMKLDGSYCWSLFTKPGTGLAVWATIIRQGMKLLLFIYEVRDGVFLVSSADQAFVAEFRYNMRELP